MSKQAYHQVQALSNGGSFSCRPIDTGSDEIQVSSFFRSFGITDSRKLHDACSQRGVALTPNTNSFVMRGNIQSVCDALKAAQG